ncbi:porin family protein [Methylomonas sp. SURF-2]|uniref:Porin family protein n=1 Tax=Methylomonas subterranea TaxID=2952225 RepID=A0ABT1TMF5_9GAMM|nr:outer membrane protein [Methylomonas sp. SURF-2]MCQ8105934.1 porin family protein [Methylomonas sp. SURF-2]
MKLTIFVGCLAVMSAPVSFAGDSALRSWTGGYAGVNLGAIWTDSQFSSRHNNFLSDNGRYAETLTSADVNPGFQFGYLHQFDSRLVLGAEADFSYPATKTHASVVEGNVYDSFESRYDLQGSLRIRAGYAIQRFLPFITAGVSFASMSFSYTNEAHDNYSTETTQTGWVLGAGIEYGFLDNLSARLEYLYTDYGKGLKMGLPEVAGASDPQGFAAANMSTNVVRAALNYRF